MRIGIYLIILVLYSCNSNQKQQENTSINTLTNDTNTKSLESNTPDSLRDFTNYYYLSDISTKDFAELYLKDSIMTNNYKKLYDCIDSLSSKDIDTRNYYFKVLINILDNPEVVFHQNMGVFLVKYIEKFKNEFLVGLSKMSDEEIKFYAQGIQSYLSKKQNNGEKWISEIKLLKEESNTEQLNRLNLFFKEIELAKNTSME